MSLEGKVAFVSGSSGLHGIGRAIALALLIAFPQIATFLPSFMTY